MTEPKSEEKSPTKKAAEKEPPKPTVPFSKLFRFASRTDKILMTIGALAAAINGFAMPVYSFIFGQMVDEFGSGGDAMEQLVHNAGVQSMWFAIIGSVSFALSIIQMSFWIISGENQSIRYRRAYFSAILKQEVGWFDKNDANQLSTKIATECFAIQGAIGDKVPTCLMSTSMFFAGFIIGYLRGWQLSLVVTAGLPLMVMGGFVIGFIMKKSEGISQKAYAKAGGSAEQSLNAIKTVKSLNGEEFELSSYSSRLIEAFKSNVRFGAYNGLGVGFMFCTMFLCYALSFWYGGKLIDDETDNSTYGRPYTAGDVVVVFFSILSGSFQLGQISPCFKDFIKGQEAAKSIFDVIDRKPEIFSKPNAKKLDKLEGAIDLSDIKFSYPSKLDVQTLKGVSIQIVPHQKTALVGESGCGKSTIMQLIERFYDPQEGTVTIDGVDVRDLDLKWMRNQIGYVGQEPVLFAASIRENLQFGNSDATEKEMIDALKQANAWDFVNQLEKKLDTYVGNMGNQFSGGQKQRLCIARAILKNPKILLLDEATSALDRKNEREIQETLDYVSSGRTTLVIAHRLKTVQNADRIFVIDEGHLVEEGTYQELIDKKGGKFAGLAKNQILKEVEGEIAQAKVYEQTQEMLTDNDHAIKGSYHSLKSNKTHKNSVIPAVQSASPDVVEEKTAAQKKKELAEQEKKDRVFTQRLFELNKPERGWFYLGILVTIGNGAGFPIAGLILAEFISVLSETKASDFMTQVYYLSLYFIILGFSILILYAMQIYLFTRVGESLTLRIRRDTFQKMLRMPCSWFDKNENTPGSLASRLSSDCQLINVLTTSVMAIQFQNYSTLTSGIVIAFVATWRVTLVGLGMMPLLIISGILQMKFVQGFSESSDKAYKGSGNIITDSVTNIRTVASFANEQKIMQMFEQNLEFPQKQLVKKGFIQGTLFGFSQFAMFAVYAVIFYVSAIFVRDYGVTIKEMYISIFCIMFAGMGAGNNNAFQGDVGSAKNACRNIFKILDSEDEVQQQKNLYNSQEKQLNEIGCIQFQNVSFKYPSRDTSVFKNLSFKINPGEHSAFVGPSGCGKSTVMQILLRFYDEYTGYITINGVDIRQYNINSLRSNFGVIFQDPILFDTSFRENIQYNTPGVRLEDIREAASTANALSFIEGHEAAGNEGFERRVGLKGSQISGGQKQRVAVARAILKKPKVMLLDEATSALDQENERILQEALEKILQGKTSLTIAHRINTIQNSDTIFVMQDGKIMEQGNFNHLMALKGFFYNMNKN